MGIITAGLQVPMGERFGREVMSAIEVAEYLQLNKGTVYRLAREGKLPGAKVGRAWRFKRSLIDEWVSTRTMPVASRPQCVHK